MHRPRLTTSKKRWAAFEGMCLGDDSCLALSIQASVKYETGLTGYLLSVSTVPRQCCRLKLQTWMQRVSRTETRRNRSLLLLPTLMACSNCLHGQRVTINGHVYQQGSAVLQVEASGRLPDKQTRMQLLRRRRGQRSESMAMHINCATALLGCSA